MASISNVPQLVDKKGASYSTVSPRLELGKFNKWKKCMLCYLMGMEPYYIQCIKDGPFIPKTAEGDDKHDFEGPSDTKENRIIDLKLEYQTFRAKPSESLSQTYTHYKTLLNELTNDDVILSKHKINVSFVNSLPKKWLSFFHRLRNANHTQTLDFADIYRRFVYEDNLISRRYPETKTALVTTPSDSPKSTVFFSNNILQDFQENSYDDAYERSSEEYLRDLELEFHKRALLTNSKHFIKRKNNFLSQKQMKTLNVTNVAKKVILQEIAFPKHEEDVFDDEEMTQVKVLMALADDELSVGNNHA
ncbi:hypothetical protein Tco_1154441 [Tanacetum coccineum]